jgi:hypothetical protein
MFDVIVRYVNGSNDVFRMKSFSQAQDFYRHHISYSGGRVKRVEVDEGLNSVRAIWDIDWTPESRARGLWA